jgi:hypothetical protein
VLASVNMLIVNTFITSSSRPILATVDANENQKVSEEI